MRIGVLHNAGGWNVAYRAEAPAEALRVRGHDISVVVRAQDGSFDQQSLLSCDVVHIYRMADEPLRRYVTKLQSHGVAVTWDNDDDVRLMPARRQGELGYTALKIRQEWQGETKMMRTADVVTTTTEHLVEAFHAAGATRVHRIENFLFSAQYRRPLRRKGELTIGWVAGAEHEADERALRISSMLSGALARHPTLRVVTVGLPLDLDPARYDRHVQIPLRDVNDQVRTWDVAIAPLGDIPMSYARSTIKVKEYAAAGVPWLASARGPYADLGPDQGGMLVGDDEWPLAVDAVLKARFKRFLLARRAAAWAKTQSIDRHVDQWETVFEQAIEAARARHGSERTRQRAAAPHAETPA